MQNLKLAAQTYLEAGSIAKLEQKFMVKSEAANSARQTILQMERQLKTLGEILKYAQQYQTNRPYYLKYKKAKNPDISDAILIRTDSLVPSFLMPLFYF